MGPSFDLQHRPWPLPRGPWVMRQQWEDLLFAHWPCPVSALTPRLPRGLTLDTFDGRAWLGVVPFRMSGVRLRGLPGVPTATHFAELNVRTYVTDGARAGVWFFSLDAASGFAVATARRWFHLPYFNADMRVASEGEAVRYSSARTHRDAPEAAFDATYGPAGPAASAAPGTLEHWLTERYCLYAANGRGRVSRGEIHHAPWPLQPAWARISVNTMPDAADLQVDPVPPLLHFARALDVRIWAPRRI
jgi:uncharacterized protein YqjF (DUF2071 family)